jgi:hypothetical protein
MEKRNCLNVGVSTAAVKRSQGGMDPGSLRSFTGLLNLEKHK